MADRREQGSGSAAVRWEEGAGGQVTRELERHGWPITVGVTCVSCPGCGFTFDAEHTDEPRGDQYSCPTCDASESDAIRLLCDAGYVVTLESPDGSVVTCKACEPRPADTPPHAQPNERAGSSGAWPTIHPHVEGGYVWTDCPTCGADVAVDEDGCCMTCGEDATHYGERAGSSEVEEEPARWLVQMSHGHSGDDGEEVWEDRDLWETPDDAEHQCRLTRDHRTRVVPLYTRPSRPAAPREEPSERRRGERRVRDWGTRGRARHDWTDDPTKTRSGSDRRSSPEGRTHG
jgi:hypothetical protein